MTDSASGASTEEPGLHDALTMDATRTGPPGSTSPSEEVELAPGDLVDGCFRVERVLGRGGMGVVHLADHLQLDRKVALKLHSSTTGRAGTLRLLREARAMARLVHDNVVTIYDVGAIDDRVYIAMEFVDGGTLREWLTDRPRTWQEILRVLVAAGRGLAAAHEQGLVHRDFKPDNVLIGTDGRVRVADFGLARPTTEGSEDPLHQVPPGSGVTSTTDGGWKLTETKGLVGTPAYMAPEQLEGRPADALSDQFAFCVSAFETLYGQRPFPGDTLGALVANVLHGEVTSAPAEKNVPSAVRRALRRGLRRDPSARFASMADLLRILEHDTTAARRRWWSIVLGAGAVVGAVLVTRSDRADDPCTGGRDRIAEVWDEYRGDELERSMAQGGGPLGTTVGPRVRARLDRYAEAWEGAYREACEETWVLQTQSEHALDLRMACLDGRRQELAALVETLGEAEAEVVAKADQASLSLVALTRCTDVEALRRIEPIEDGDRAAAEAIERTLAQAKARDHAGRYEQARELAEEALLAARELGYLSVVAKARHEQGSALSHLGRADDSVHALEQSVYAAVASGDDHTALESLVLLVYAAGYRQERFDEGARWLQQSDAWLHRLDVSGPPEIQRHLNESLMLRQQGRITEALAAIRRAEALIESHPAEDVELLRPRALSLLASTLAIAGELDVAVATHERAIAALESLYGPDHPSVASELNSLAGALLGQGGGGQARSTDLFRRALEIRRTALGPEHPVVLESQHNLALALQAQLQHADALTLLEDAVSHVDRAEPRIRASIHSVMATSLSNAGRMTEAEAAHRRALSVAQQTFPADDPLVLGITTNLVSLLVKAERYEETIALARQALETIDASPREELGAIEGYLSLHLGEVYNEQDRCEDAKPHYERAIEQMEANLGPAHVHLQTPLTGLANCLLKEDRPARARELLERALPMLEQLDDQAKAQTRLFLAKALWALGEHEEARAVASRARDEIGTLDPRPLDRWLREHRD